MIRLRIAARRSDRDVGGPVARRACSTPAAAYASSSSSVSCSSSACASESSLRAVLRQQRGDLVVRLVDDAAHLVVDQLLRSRRDLGRAGQQRAARRRRAARRAGRSSSLMPQRPTIWRAICVSCWMSDSAPVVGSPKTTSSAARPPSATLIFATQLAALVVEAVGVRRRERHAERQAARDDRDLAHRVGARR